MKQSPSQIQLSELVTSENSVAGAWLVLGSAMVWSTGGLIARLVQVQDPWSTVFWRSGTAVLFLLAFMLYRDGISGTRKLFKEMGLPGLAVAFCFAIASTCFLIALKYTTVANILLMQAGVPLIAALISYLFFHERLKWQTWSAIAVVIAGVAVMVSDSLTGKVSPIGDGLSLLIAFAFASATVITRRFANIRMTPAVCTGTLISFGVALAVILITGGTVVVAQWQVPILILFGFAMSLGLVLFTIGVRLVPSAFAALLGTAETILGPVWVWVFLGEVPVPNTLIGGGIVLTALIVYLAWQIGANRRMKRIVPMG